ncbi:predicted protein [Postia placenta Mad-698-R]|nr:predicted protein [Postia placenta Mad-698-R]
MAPPPASSILRVPAMGAVQEGHTGVTREVGMDLKNMKARKVAVFTDPIVAKLPPAKMAIASLESQNDLPFVVYDRVVAEPTEASWRDAIAWAREQDCSHFLAVGGGSVMDTAKAANLFSVYKDADLFDFINAPVGKGLPITQTLRPLIAEALKECASVLVPTTAGTGSETTGTAILDITSMSFKTGIANRAMKPTLDGAHTKESLECCVEWFVSPEVTLRPLDNSYVSLHPAKSLLSVMLEKIALQLQLHGRDDDPHKLFEHVVFCTNVTYSDGGFKGDLTTHAIPTNDLAHLQTQHDLASAWLSLVPNFPSQQVYILPSIEDAIKTVKRLRTSAGSPRVDVLVSGSLHLVGGVIEVAGLSEVALDSYECLVRLLLGSAPKKWMAYIEIEIISSFANFVLQLTEPAATQQAKILRHLQKDIKVDGLKAM